MAVSGSSTACDKPAQPAFKAVSKRANTMTLPMELCCLRLEAKMQFACNHHAMFSGHGRIFFALVVSDDAGS